MQHLKKRMKPNSDAKQIPISERSSATEVLLAAATLEGMSVEWAYDYSRGNEVAL